MDTQYLTTKNARIAGLFYLGIIVFGIYAEFLVRGQLIDYSNAQITLTNISSNLLLFRSGLVSDVICQTLHLGLVLILYRMLHPINKAQARFMLACVIASVAMTLLNLLHSFVPVILLNGKEYLGAFSPEQLDTIGLFFLKLHGYGYSLAGVFFGLWLYPLGVLVKDSSYFPKVLGWLLILGCFGYLVDFLHVFLLPEWPWITYPGLAIALIAEFGFCFYLLIIGLKPPQNATTYP